MISNGTGKGRQKLLCEIDGAGKKSFWCKGRGCSILSGGGSMGMDYLGAGLVSTVNDTAKLANMMWNYGVMANGKRFLKKETVKEMEVNRLLKKHNGDDRVNYIGNIGCYRDGADEYGHGGAACTYWNVEREDGTATVWFTQHLHCPDMPEGGDLWKALHEGRR